MMICYGKSIQKYSSGNGRIGVDTGGHWINLGEGISVRTFYEALDFRDSIFYNLLYRSSIKERSDCKRNTGTGKTIDSQIVFIFSLDKIM